MIFWGQRQQFLCRRSSPLDLACSSQTTQPFLSQELLRNAFHLLEFCYFVSTISNGQPEGTSDATASLLQLLSGFFSGSCRIQPFEGLWRPGWLVHDKVWFCLQPLWQADTLLDPALCTGSVKQGCGLTGQGQSETPTPVTMNRKFPSYFNESKQC